MTHWISVLSPLAAVAADEDSAWLFRTAARFNTAVRGSDAAAREMFLAPRPQDGTLDFSIESGSLAAVTTNRNPGKFSTASSFNSAVRGSDTAAHEEFPTTLPQDGTPDFGIAPALPATVTTRADSAGNSSTSVSIEAAVRGSDMAARDFVPAPRPHDGTLHFSSAPAFPAAVATHADSAGTYSTAAGFDTAVRGSETAARDFFPSPHPQDGTLESSAAPALPAPVTTRDDSAGKCRADANYNTVVRGDDAFISTCSTGDVPARKHT